uniref:Uncharacterized protein n=1 Tax=Ciona intestinalis TaxID=7719 RepID=H2XW67_CIOIN
MYHNLSTPISHKWNLRSVYYNHSHPCNAEQF